MAKARPSTDSAPEQSTAPNAPEPGTGPDTGAPEQQQQQSTEKKIDPIFFHLGTAQYSHEKGTIALYTDSRKPGVKNGRAGHVVFSGSNWNIPCSVYMDVTEVQKNGKAATEYKYRLSWPKGVKAVFPESVGGAAAEKRFKLLQLKAWIAVRESKQSTTDASGDDASISETEELTT